MLRDVWAAAQRLLSLSRDVEDSKNALRDLRNDLDRLGQRVEQLADAVRVLSFHFQRLEEREASEREKLALRLENEFLRRELRLAPPVPGDPEG